MRHAPNPRLQRTRSASPPSPLSRQPLAGPGRSVRGCALAFLFLCCATVGLAGTEVKTFTLATGEILVFPFEDGVPTPSESTWSTCQGAGPMFEPEGNRIRLSWVVILKAKGPATVLRSVSRVTLQEVSGKTAINLFSGKPEQTEDGLIISAPAELVTRASYPWLYSAGPTIFVLRVQLERPGTKPDVLMQPVLIGADVKKQIKDRGYLR
jgi:hypothetical protein